MLAILASPQFCLQFLAKFTILSFGEMLMGYNANKNCFHSIFKSCQNSNMETLDVMGKRLPLYDTICTFNHTITKALKDIGKWKKTGD